MLSDRIYRIAEMNLTNKKHKITLELSILIAQVVCEMYNVLS
jgi:hypothetical protein